LKTKVRQIPNWGTDSMGLIEPLQQSPIKSDAPIQTVTLIPMGAARLRISSFPVIGTGPDAHEWTKPATPPKASFCFASDTTTALNDRILPKNSGDMDIPRFTWWDHKGTNEWVQYDFDQPRELSSSAVYWFDDTGKGGCRVPASWKVLYLDGSEWKPVKADGDYWTARDEFNTVKFEPVSTTAIRLSAQLQEGYSGGILEWEVK
jgi:hypothetical protein